MITYVIGFIGSSRMSAGLKLAALMGEQEIPFYDLDQKIEEREERTIKQLVMAMGEHEYRNKELEILQEIVEEVGDDNAIVVCGDGTLLDDDCKDILRKGQICFVNDNPLSMWTRAREEGRTHYAFMYEEDDEVSMAKFNEVYERRLPLYKQLRDEAESNRREGEKRLVQEGEVIE
jgi:shikimate kinase